MKSETPIRLLGSLTNSFYIKSFAESVMSGESGISYEQATILLKVYSRVFWVKGVVWSFEKIYHMITPRDHKSRAKLVLKDISFKIASGEMYSSVPTRSSSLSS